MVNYYGITFKNDGKVYFFKAEDFTCPIDVTVIVETEKGLQYGTVVREVSEVEIDKKMEYKKVIRLATQADYKRYLSNLKDVNKAIAYCNELILKSKLDMRVIDASYTFDREQLIFRFVADDRIDFRQLARDLGSKFKTRIELRQVGIRDKAKEIGGIGPCGRKRCCNNFLTEFDSVSINMAKNQNLSLNPSKINGVCGRLLCCLKYENENYNEYKKGLPDVGSKIETENGIGKVISVDIFNRKYKVVVDDNQMIEVEVKNEGKK